MQISGNFHAQHRRGKFHSKGFCAPRPNAPESPSRPLEPEFQFLRKCPDVLATVAASRQKVVAQSGINLHDTSHAGCSASKAHGILLSCNSIAFHRVIH